MGKFDASDTNLQVVISALPDLGFTYDQLKRMTERHSHEVIDIVPELKYWKLGEERKMDRSPNICGHQQRAFDFFWCLEALSRGRLALSIGAGGVGAPNCLHTDRYNGVPPPNDGGRYGAGYANSMMQVNADALTWPFFSDQFGVVMFNHVFEHLADQRQALLEAIRVLAPGGYVCIIMPDMTYSKRGSIDPTHTTEWCADAFLKFVSDIKSGGENINVFEHNTFDNAFSFNTVIRKG